MKRILLALMLALPFIGLGQGVVQQGKSTTNVQWLGNYQFTGEMKLPLSSGAPSTPAGTYLLGKAGIIRYDSTNAILYVNNGTSWVAVGSGGGSLPSQTGNSGKYLTTNGTSVSWGTIDTSHTSGLSFSVLTNSTWSGGKRKTMSGSMDLATGSASTGILHLTNPASYPITVNGTSIPINNSTVNGGVTSLGYYTLDNGVIVVLDKSGNPIETTLLTGSPTISSKSATDIHTIVLTFNRAVTGTSTGISFNNGSALTVTGMTGSGTSTLTFTVSQTMTGSDVITYAISGSNLQDIASNTVANGSGSVTNSINSLPTAIAAYNMSSTADAVGSYTLTNSGSVSFSAGKNGNAAALTAGKALYNTALAPNSAGLSHTWSVNAWVNASALPVAAAHIFGRNDVSGEFLLYMLSNGALYARIFNDAGGVNLYDRPFTSGLTTNTWHMLTVVFTGSALNVYFDGVLNNATGTASGSGTQNATYYSASNRFNIGDDGSGYTFDGLLDDVVVSDIAWNSSQVTALYNSTSGVEY